MAIEADEGSALHYTLSVRIHCSGYCGGHGVCRLHKEQVGRRPAHLFLATFRGMPTANAEG